MYSNNHCFCQNRCFIYVKLRVGNCRIWWGDPGVLEVCGGEVIVGLHERGNFGGGSSDAANLDDVVAGCVETAKPKKVTR